MCKGCEMFFKNIAVKSGDFFRGLEESDVPVAVYQFVDGHIQTVLVSNGLVRWQAPGFTREDLLYHLNTDMYKNVHREDIVFIATKAKEFAKNRDARYEVI